MTNFKWGGNWMSQVFADMEHLIGYGTGPKSWTIEKRPVGRLNIRMPSGQYENSYHKDQAVSFVEHIIFHTVCCYTNDTIAMLAVIVMPENSLILKRTCVFICIRAFNTLEYFSIHNQSMADIYQDYFTDIGQSFVKQHWRIFQNVSHRYSRIGDKQNKI